MRSELYLTRRQRMLTEMGERAVAILPAAPTFIRNNDVEHDYRQESDLFYLTGFDEPDSVLVLSGQPNAPRATLLLRPRDPSREIWDGPRLGIERAPETLGVDAAFEIAHLDAKLAELITGAERIYYRLNRDRALDDRVLAAIEIARRRHRYGKDIPSEIVDPGRIVHAHRLRKDAHEVHAMRRAAEVTRAAHLAAMKVAKPGVYEYEIEAEVRRVFRAQGSERPAYAPIVGSGPNATILHHRRNDRRLEDGELLLIDAGAEVDYYACDVTRTFPVSGRFSAPQRAIYEAVLRTQRACIDAVRPGATLEEIHDIAVRETARELVALGLIAGPVDAAIASDSYKAFYMHRTSHWLGMDVHDVGPYFTHGAPTKLAPGMVLTIEPGLYIGADADVDPSFRGIGVRIEDDVLVTDGGHENLTAGIPKDVAEIERILSAR